MSKKSSKQDITNRSAWLSARRELLKREKELTLHYDEVRRARLEMPRVRIEKAYSFQTPDGPKTLGDLFSGRSQLLVYHFMFGPESDGPCKSCSFWADGFDAVRPHLAARDVELVAISRAPLDRLRPFATRLGWSFPWYSSHGSDFNRDFRVSFSEDEVSRQRLIYNYETQSPDATETQGISAFYRDADGQIFHTYSTYGRGVEPMNAAYRFLDLAPKGRDEDDLPHIMAWVQLHDEYAA